jgi:sterol desaturase/sphingolipid hydroxylase (fatty acid hydroxylase superfamily)
MDEFVWYLKESDGYAIIPYAAPIFFLLVGLEWYVITKKKLNAYDIKDSLAATAVGIGNVGIGLLLKIANFALMFYFFMLVPWRIPVAWWSFILCFIAVDFFRYWAHRIAHEQRFWWATHVTHHSSKHYNFTVGFRLGWTQIFKIIFFVPVVLMGFDLIVFFICHQLAVLYQFWIHTPLINKCPRPIEYFFVTPSHHRVHHGTNAQYIDKNYGSTFIIWDRMFGTFEPEGEEVVYGITKPIKHPYNPIYLVFHEWVDIWHDLKKCTSFKEGWNLLFGPPGGPLEAEEQPDARLEKEEVKKEPSLESKPAA